MHKRGMKSGRALLTAAVVAVSVGPMAAPSDAQDARAALDQAPQAVEAVLVVPNLASLNEQIARLKGNLGLPMPELDDALGSFKQTMGMVQGVDDDGSLLIVVPNLAESIEAGGEPEFLLLMPVTDYAAFTQSLTGGEAGAAAGGGVTGITLPDGQPGFVRQVERHAVMGQTQEAVTAYQPGGAGQAIVDSLGGLGQRYLNAADALIYIDVERLAPTLLSAIDEAMAEQAAGIDQQAQGGMIDPAIVANARAAAKLYADAATTILQGSRGLVMALDLTDEGVSLTQTLGLKQGSELAGFFEGQGEPRGLSQLPDQPFIFAAAIDTEALKLADLYRTLLEALPKQGNPMLQNIDQWMPLIERVKNASFAFYAPNEMAMMSGGVFNTLTLLEVDDPETYVDTFRKYVESVDGLQVPAGPMPPADGGMPGDAQAGAAQANITYSTTYTENVLQLQGVQVDQFQVTANFPPQMMQQMGPAAGFMNMFASYSGYVANKGGNVLITTVPDPQLVTRGFQALDQGGGIGAAGAVSRIREHALPPNAVYEGYLSIGGIAQGANIFLGMMGMPPIQVPADLPPIASGLGTQGDSAAYRVYVPVETIQFVVDTAQMLQNQAGPGMGPGHRHGGPPPF